MNLVSIWFQYDWAFPISVLLGMFWGTISPDFPWLCMSGFLRAFQLSFGLVDCFNISQWSIDFQLITFVSAILAGNFIYTHLGVVSFEVTSTVFAVDVNQHLKLIHFGYRTISWFNCLLVAASVETYSERLMVFPWKCVICDCRVRFWIINIGWHSSLFEYYRWTSSLDE